MTKYVPYSAFATKTVFDLRSVSVIQSGVHAGELEIHIGPRREDGVRPGGKGFAVQGDFDRIGNRTRGVDNKYCLLAGFSEVFELVSKDDAGSGMCLVLKPLGIGLGFCSLLAANGRRVKKLLGMVKKLQSTAHARVNQCVGSKLQDRRGIVMELTQPNHDKVVTPLDAWTIGEALALLDHRAAEIGAEGWRSHRGGYCEECGCVSSDSSRRWDFHRNGENMSLRVRPTAETQS